MADYLIVRASRPRRRAGRRFGKTPVRLKLANLSEDEIAAIKADPVLSVSDEAAEKKPKEPKQPAKEKKPGDTKAAAKT